jgi:putative hemolysin
VTALLPAISAKLAAIGVLFALSVVFAASETSLMSLSRLQLARLRKVRPGRLDFWERDPDRVVVVLLLVDTLASVAFGVLSTSIALDLERAGVLAFHWGGWLVPALVGGSEIVTAEILPKVLARNYPEAIALRLAPAVRLLTALLGPSVKGVVTATEALLVRLSRTVKTEQAAWDASLVSQLLDRSTLSPSLRAVLRNLLDFGKLPVSEVLVPKEEVFAVDAALPRPEFVARVLGSGYSRVPVHRGSLDSVVGIVYAKDLLAFWRSESLIVLEDLIRPALRVTSDVPLAQTLREFRQGRHHMALVTDKQGKVQGLVTLQDTLEAIVGAIAEEPDLAPGAGKA